MNNISCFEDEQDATTSHHVNFSPIKYWRQVSVCSKSPNQLPSLCKNSAKKVKAAASVESASSSSSSSRWFKKKKRVASVTGEKEMEAKLRNKVIKVTIRKPVVFADLPLLPLSYVCSRLTLIEREALSQVLPTLSAANKMAWFRRTAFNVRVDVSFYVHQEGENDSYDDNFEFTSLMLLSDKFRRLANCFNKAAHLRSIDFSAPVNSSATVNKWGYLMSVPSGDLYACLSGVNHSVSEVDLRHTVMTLGALRSLQATLGCSLRHLRLTLGAVVWPRDALAPRRTGDARHHLLAVLDRGEPNSFGACSAHVCELLLFLYDSFSRLKCVYLYD